VGRAGAAHRTLAIRVFRSRAFSRDVAIERPMCGSANRSLACIEPVSGVPKRKSENTEQRPPPQTRASSAAIPEKLCQRLARPALSPENAAGSRKRSMCPTETGMVGCGRSLRANPNPCRSQYSRCVSPLSSQTSKWLRRKARIGARSSERRGNVALLPTRILTETGGACQDL
jgi:hypothetical protein